MNKPGPHREEAPDPSRRLLPGDRPDRAGLPVAVNRRRRSLGRLAAYLGASLAAIALAVAVLVLVLGNTLVNAYGKGRAERAFATAYPGWVLRLGVLSYEVGANRLVVQSVALSGTHTTLKTGPVTLTGVRRSRLLSGTTPLVEALEGASLDATNLHLEFPRANYGIRCARLRASVPRAELIAEETELRPLVEDEAFFAANDFRTTRFRVVVPELRVAGLALGELLQGSSYRASSVDFIRPSLDTLVNCDKPVKPFLTSPLMVHEALGLIREPLRADRLRITDGRLTYSERMSVGSAPAVLTFGAVDFSVDGIANRGDATAAIQIQAQGELMDAGTLKVQMSIPITPPDFSFQYSGSLSAMDLTRLNAFIDLTQHIRIKSGTAEAAAFDIQVVAGVARGRFQGSYRDLQVAVLDKQTGSERGLDNRVTSFLANVLKVRTANRSEGSGALKEGQVNHARQPADAFLEFVWAALWSGVRDAITH